MAVQLIVSNALGVLAERLSTDLRLAGGSVFRPQYIVTQTTGMNNWLKMKIAAGNGITANIRFEKPNDIIYQVYFSLDGPKEEALAADNLGWVLFTLLNDPDFARRFPAIAGYFPGGDDLKRLGLARKMGDLFDQYQIYRPELIEGWNRAAAEELNADWQCWLWVKAKKNWKAICPIKRW